ncbi:hypothetical protein MRX96_019157 [Rhipicephalus microplus]
MALSENELAVLLSLFQDEQLEKRTFEYLGQALQHNFAKQDHFCVSCDLNPPEETGGKKPEFAHVIPKLTLHEKYFLWRRHLNFPAPVAGAEKEVFASAGIRCAAQAGAAHFHDAGRWPVVVCASVGEAD